ncbi:MAG TPA: PAS domain S-box protein [Chthonomonadaceae bacterium]|nr:PAS domain S-box protein [Chthonomonadaceae bacterium]
MPDSTPHNQDPSLEERFRQAEERLRLVLESVRDYAIFTLDKDNRVTSWNAGAQHILGYEAQEILGQSGSLLFTPEDRERGEPEKELRTAEAEGRAEDERWHMRKDGSRFWASGVMTALRDGELHGFVKIMRDMTERKQAEEERARQQAYIAEQERRASVLQERNRIALDIHDSLAQGFAGIAMQLEVAENALEQSRKAIVQARDIARQSLGDARRSIRALRPEGLEGRALAEALAHLVEQTRFAQTARTDFALAGTPYALPSEIEVELLRIAQEALTNAQKHAQATHIQITLTFASDQVRLSIQDNGIGFDTTQEGANSRYGLPGMRERAERIGGRLTMTSQPGQGALITVIVPIPESALPSPEV